MAQPKNLLFIMTDNHSRDMAGCYGHPLVRTPNIDRLAASGTRFANAYCASPLCCPARAALATGRYPHQSGYWDNAIVYDGSVPSWMHRARAEGHDVVSIGKLHFRSSEDDNGFSEEILPMHILDGKGAAVHLLRGSDDEPGNPGQWELYAERSGIGETEYQRFDEKIAERACQWLSEHAGRPERRWILFVSFASPHPPFTVPARFFDLYPPDRIPLPADAGPEKCPRHPAIVHLRRIMQTRDISDPAMLRRVTAGYFGLITFVDELIGRIVGHAENLGLLEHTRFAYTSDHGELVGLHGLFGKSNLYEGAVGVPLILSGPGIPAGNVVDEPVSHIDLYPTVLASIGVVCTEQDESLPGSSLWPMMLGQRRKRPLFAEYHATGSHAGAFVLREGRYKLIYYVGQAPQVFDLEEDPDEYNDLAATDAGPELAKQLEGVLRRICDPEAIDRRAKADQRAKLVYWGGRDAVLADAVLVYTPPPGAPAETRELKAES